ncbi:unnamed protein product [Prunus armeniaca]
MRHGTLLSQKPNTATKHPEWHDAMTKEVNALLKNHTWSLVPSSPSQNLVGCKWVFQIKSHSDDSIERFKARLVATICIVLSLAVSRDWSLCQLDNTFIHRFLQEDVYMAQLPSFIDPTRPSHVCNLHKAFYGLKQAPRAWLYRISLPYYLSSSICRRHHGGHFDTKDLGSLSYFLGLQVLLYVSNGALISNPTEYCKLVGSLQYLTLTRPDISFVVNIVAQFITHLFPYSDANWAGCLDSRWSTTGYVITLGTNLIS